jgi:hypothetical protein
MEESGDSGQEEEEEESEENEQEEEWRSPETQEGGGGVLNIHQPHVQTNMACEVIGCSVRTKSIITRFQHTSLLCTVYTSVIHSTYGFENISHSIRPPSFLPALPLLVQLASSVLSFHDVYFPM